MESTDESKLSHVSFEKIDLGSQLPHELDFLRHLDEDVRPLACEFIQQGAGQLLANNLNIKLNQFSLKKGKKLTSLWRTLRHSTLNLQPCQQSRRSLTM